MTRQPWQHQQASHRRLGVSLLAVAGIVIVLLVTTLMTGRLTPAAILINLIIIVGTLLVGIIFVRGDEIGGSAIDEGQRDAQNRAKSLAFAVAFYGLFVLFLGAGFFPKVFAAPQIASGLLLLVVIVVWLGGYMWYRWWA